jgi:hypothetical protein
MKTKSEPILEEVWRIKDDLAREAGYDLHRLCENTRQWATAHPHAGPRVRNAEELRRVLAGLERQRAQESALVLNDALPPKE